MSERTRCRSAESFRLSRRSVVLGGLMLPVPALAQAVLGVPGPPTPGLAQASSPPPEPGSDVSAEASPALRGRTLVVVNKLGLTLGFYDPLTGEEQVSFALPPRPHEIAVSRDRRTAFISVYGDGIYGQNPHPGDQIAVIDLVERRPVRFLSTQDVKAPHGLAVGPDGRLWVSADIGARVLGFDPASGMRTTAIETGTTGSHWLVLSPDGRTILTSNRATPGIPVLDVARARRVGEIGTPRAVTGIALSPDGARLYASDDGEPVLHVADVVARRIVASIDLIGLPRTSAASDRERRVAVAPDGRTIVVTDSLSAAAVAVDAADPRRQRLLLVEKGPMGIAFSEDSRTALVANHDVGTITLIDVPSWRALRDIRVGEGPETMALV